jgi:Tol biopolymer transport system component
MLGFNHTPLLGISTEKVPGCGTNYYYSYKNDSTGFWFVNRDGSGLRKVLNFTIYAPAWSPDGKWLAFNNGPVIYKMKFDGINFDTSNIIPLSDFNFNSFHPSWSGTGDTIYFDASKVGTSDPFKIYKMPSTGGNQILIGNKGKLSIYSRDPFYTSDNKILHVRGDSLSFYVFTMDCNGDNVKQLSSNINITPLFGFPKQFKNTIFYEDRGLWVIDTLGNGVHKIADNTSQGYSISKDGIIAFVNFVESSDFILSKQNGCLWLINTDGTNPHTFITNNY